MTTAKLRRKRRYLLGKMRGRCSYCGQRMRHESATLDHFVPRSAGGTTANDNAVVACFDCNQIKADNIFATLAEAIAFIARVKRERRMGA